VQTIDGVMYGSDKAGQIARRGYRPGTTGFEGHQPFECRYLVRPNW
jgi:hypothetical protein